MLLPVIEAPAAAKLQALLARPSGESLEPVSYTHLDVYKRQVHTQYQQCTDGWNRLFVSLTIRRVHFRTFFDSACGNYIC